MWVVFSEKCGLLMVLGLRPTGVAFRFVTFEKKLILCQQVLTN